MINYNFNCKTNLLYNICIYMYVLTQLFSLQLENFYINFLNKMFYKTFSLSLYICIYIYIYIYNNAILTKWKCDFKKWDLQHIKHPRVIMVRFIGPLPWYGIVTRHEALDVRYSDSTLSFSMWDINSWFVKYIFNERKILNRIHAKVGDKNSYILRRIFTIEVEMGMID